MKKSICFYHSADLDGHCSGAIVKNLLSSNVELIGVNYGDAIPWEKIDKNTKVWIVDFSFPIEDMKRIQKSCAMLRWIDHHKTAIEAAHEAGFKCEGLLSVDHAACTLTWEYINGVNNEEQINEVVRLLGLYDIWKHEDPNVLPLQYGLRTEYTKPDNTGLWDVLLSHDSINSQIVKDMIYRGKVIIEYEKRQNEIVAKSSSFDLDFEGVKFIAVNRTCCGSMILDSVFDPAKYEACCIFGWSKGRWKVSMFSNNNSDVDLSAIAKKYGGGGHKGACGFTCKTLPFKLGA